MDPELLAAAPLFLAALIIATYAYLHSDRGGNGISGASAPAFQSVVSFCHDNVHKPSARRQRKRVALAAIHMAMDLLSDACAILPCGRRPTHGRRQGSVQKLATWLVWLETADHDTALSALGSSSNTVHVEVRTKVETEYNSVCDRYGLHRLEPGGLGRMFDALRTPPPVQRNIAAYNSRSSDAPTVYYVAAGIGCGIRQIEQVLLPSLHSLVWPVIAHFE